MMSPVPRLLFAAIFALACAGCQQPVSQPAQVLPPVAKGVPPRTAAAGEDWPCLLGPRHDGTSLETGLLSDWPAAGPPVLWKKTIGTGYSAPSVRGEKLVLHHRLRNEDIVECLHAVTGESVWQLRRPTRFSDPYGYNNGPRCSPLLTAEHCYTLAADGRLLCVALSDGQPVWEKELFEEYNIPEGFFGVGATPLLEDGKLVVLVGGQPNSGVVAFDLLTGRELWKNVGQSTWDGAATTDPNEPRYEWTGTEMVVSYSSPIAATIHGQRHLLCLMRQGLVSLDPATGAERFHYWFRSRAHESVNAARPVVVDDTILLGNAYRVGSVCLKVAADGRSTSELWRKPDLLATHWSTAIHHAGAFYGFSGRHENEGTFQCVDAATGRLLWSHTGMENDAIEKLDLHPDGKLLDRTTGATAVWPACGRGSAILVEGKFIVLSERGSLALFDATSDRPHRRALWMPPELSYPCWTAPVLSHGKLYLRSEDRLLCIDLANQSK